MPFYNKTPRQSEQSSPALRYFTGSPGWGKARGRGPNSIGSGLGIDVRISVGRLPPCCRVDGEALQPDFHGRTTADTIGGQMGGRNQKLAPNPA